MTVSYGSKRLDFAVANNVLGFSIDTNKRLLGDLLRSESHLVDLSSGSDATARLLAVFLPDMNNDHNACELVPLGASGRVPELVSLFGEALDKAECWTLTQSKRDRLLTETAKGLACCEDDLVARGFHRVGGQLLLVRPLGPADHSKPNERDDDWRPVADDAMIKHYWDVAHAAFEGVAGTTFPDYEQFKNGVLSAITPPEILMGADGPDAFVKLGIGTTQDEVALDLIGRAPSRRGGQLGDRAMARALQLARENGAKRMVVSVEASNRPALDLYGRHSFTCTSKQQSWLKALS